jgi:hypothetical protein
VVVSLLDSDAFADIVDEGLTAAETHLEQLLPSFPPLQIARGFQKHVHSHLLTELENIAHHGHRSDDPNDSAFVPSSPSPTPGPWQCEFYIPEDSNCGAWIVRGTSGRGDPGDISPSDTIAFVEPNGRTHEPSDFAEANARLIAQAPTMQDKLAQIADIIVDHYGEEDEPFSKENLLQILDSIVEVLDKK